MSEHNTRVTGPPEQVTAAHAAHAAHAVPPEWDRDRDRDRVRPPSEAHAERTGETP
ncbi:hypothetical protein [Streptomyces sp. NPDC090994]|uniref:hypothetical protein n=1 Tax=Streptomyces sp. NPDC090994 TaxID=3365969 RepID=UPI0037FF9BAD